MGPELRHPPVIGIGSLPFTDPEEAVDFVLRTTPELPYWPQLPQRTPREGMLQQLLAGLDDVVDLEAAVPRFRAMREDGILPEQAIASIVSALQRPVVLPKESFAGLYALRERLRKRGRQQRVKGQVAGPITAAWSLGVGGNSPESERLRPIRRALCHRVEAVARAQAEMLHELAGGFVLQVDEPLLEIDGEHGWKAAGALVQEGGMTLLHTCGPVTHLPELLGIHPAVSFDASTLRANGTAAGWMAEHGLQEGRWIVLGVAPTHESQRAACETARAEWLDLLKRMPELRKWVSVSPTCGLGLSSPAEAESAFRICAEFAAEAGLASQGVKE